MKLKVGFIGLGTMGTPMARSLLKAGYSLRVFNRTPSKIAPLVEDGAQAAESYADAARGADAVITVLSDSPVVSTVITGPNGVLEGCASGTVVIDMSTISPSTAAEIAEQCASRGVDFLDAPVSGGESGARAGTLSIMVGGSKQAVEKVRPLLEAMGSRITYMGSSGKGQAAKLCNQVICGLNILAVCEGLALGVSSGLDAETLLNAVSGGAAGSWMLSNLAPRMLERDWSPGFKIALQQKDLRLALEAASAISLPLPGTSLASQMFRVAEAKGLSEEGTQALFKVMELLGNLPDLRR